VSTDLYRDDGIILNRFYGGHARGTCYQITESGSQRIDSVAGVVQVTTEQAMQIYVALGKALDQEAQRSVVAVLAMIGELRGEHQDENDGE